MDELDEMEVDVDVKVDVDFDTDDVEGMDVGDVEVFAGGSSWITEHAAEEVRRAIEAAKESSKEGVRAAKEAMRKVREELRECARIAEEDGDDGKGSCVKQKSKPGGCQSGAKQKSDLDRFSARDAKAMAEAERALAQVMNVDHGKAMAEAEKALAQAMSGDHEKAIADAHRAAEQAMASVRESGVEDAATLLSRYHGNEAAQKLTKKEAIERARAGGWTEEMYKDALERARAEGWNGQDPLRLRTGDDGQFYLEPLEGKELRLQAQNLERLKELGYLGGQTVLTPDTLRDLEARVRALEKKLGVENGDEKHGLRKRIAELERRSGGGSPTTVTPRARRPRVHTAPVAPVPPAPPVPAAPAPPAPGHEDMPELWMRRSPPTPPPGMAPRPGEGQHRREREVRSGDQRRDLQERMQRMREEMDELRQEMSRLREELGSEGGER